LTLLATRRRTAPSAATEPGWDRSRNQTRGHRGEWLRLITPKRARDRPDYACTANPTRLRCLCAQGTPHQLPERMGRGAELRMARSIPPPSPRLRETRRHARGVALSRLPGPSARAGRWAKCIISPSLTRDPRGGTTPRGLEPRLRKRVMTTVITVRRSGLICVIRKTLKKTRGWCRNLTRVLPRFVS
jgi:hypothetical protein